MTLREVLQTIAKRWILVLGGAIVALIFGILISASTRGRFEATTSVVLVQPEVTAAGDQGTSTQQKLNLLAITYAEASQSKAFVDRALAANASDASKVDVAASTVVNTPVIKITVQSSDRTVAEGAATALEQAISTETATGAFGLPSGGGLHAVVLEAPHASSVSANALFILAAALIAGLSLSVTVAVLLES